MFLLKLIESLCPGMLSFMIMVPNSILWTGSFHVWQSPSFAAVTTSSASISYSSISCSLCWQITTLSLFKSHIQVPFLLLLPWRSQPTSVSPRVPVLCKLTLKERMGKGLGMATEVRGVLDLSHFHTAQACSTGQQKKVCLDYSENCIFIYISRSLSI